MTGVPNALLRVGVVVTRLLGTDMFLAEESQIVQSKLVAKAGSALSGISNAL